MTKRIVVLGGYGNLGRAVSEALAAEPEVECVIAGRRAGPGRALAERLGAGFAHIDVTDPTSLKGGLAGAYAVVDTCGPFSLRTRAAAEECARQGVHYIDVADAPDYFQSILELNVRARRSGSVLVTGASSVPGVASALIEAQLDAFDRIDSIVLHVAWHGTRAFGPATLHALVGGSSQGPRPKDGRVDAPTWSDPERVSLPAPLGVHRMYRLTVPGLELLAHRYATNSVTARAALARPGMNRALAALGRLRRRGWAAGRAPLRLFALLGGRGRVLVSAVGVELQGERAGAPVTQRVHLLARDTSIAHVAASPAIALLRRWVRQGAGEPGAYACVGLVDFEDLKAELLTRDVVLVLS